MSRPSLDNTIRSSPAPLVAATFAAAASSARAIELPDADHRRRRPTIPSAVDLVPPDVTGLEVGCVHRPTRSAQLQFGICPPPASPPAAARFGAAALDATGGGMLAAVGYEPNGWRSSGNRDMNAKEQQ